MKTEKNILIAFILNLAFSIFELIGGAITNSVAIYTDAIHDMGDSLSIGISYFLEKISKKNPDDKYTYGYIRYSIIGSVVTTSILLTGSIFIIYSAIKRLINPVSINYDGMIIFAILGVFINFLAVYFTRNGNSLNQKAVNLHMLEDVLGWGIVLVGSIIMKFTDIVILDSILSILVAIFILVSSLKNMKKVLELFLEKIPDNISVFEIRKCLLEIEDIVEVHHIHIWSIDGYHNYATMHVVTQKPSKKTKDKIREELKEHNITHVTIELEESNEKCVDEECHLDTNTNHIHSHHH